MTCIDEERGKGDLRYEVWVNEKGREEDEEEGKGGMFRWKRGGQLPKGTRSVSFADMGKLFSLFLSFLAEFTDPTCVNE